VESALDRVVAFPRVTQQIGVDDAWVRGYGNHGGVRAPPAQLLLGSEDVESFGSDVVVEGVVGQGRRHEVSHPLVVGPELELRGF
jgi:hypothetical protein